MSSAKDNNNSPIAQLKDMKFGYLTDNKFKIAVLKKVNKKQENSERQFHKIMEKYVSKMRYSQRNRNHSGFEKCNE